jgi:hypothetical protein
VPVPGDGEGSHRALCGTHPHGRAAHNLLTDQGVGTAR